MLWLLHDEAIFIESGILIPLVIVETLWWCQAFQHNYFALFPDKYPLSITMVITFYTVFTLFSYGKVFGALVAGMTSEGGGAVAFPVNFNLFWFSLNSQHLQVMTLALGITPTVARDFSVMIQSVGIIIMCANPNSIRCPKKLDILYLLHCMKGSFIRHVCCIIHYSLDEGKSFPWTSMLFNDHIYHDFLFEKKVKLEWHSLFFCSLGAIGGMILGFEVFPKPKNWQSFIDEIWLQGFR